jgi:hypothetical protein
MELTHTIICVAKHCIPVNIKKQGYSMERLVCLCFYYLEQKFFLNTVIRLLWNAIAIS